MKNILYFILLPVLLFRAAVSFGGTVKGRITDKKEAPLPYATVYIQGTTIGVTAGADGNYELSLAPGTYKVVCRFVGYKQSSFNVTITGNETVPHNFSLFDESLEMKEVVVHASSEDPAYAIIRSAIARRKFHLEQVQSFQTSIYLKGEMKSRTLPDKFMGQKIKSSDLGVDSNGKGILYLCEEKANYYSSGQKARTVIHSVRESGDPNGFGFSQFPPVITFYENNINLFSNDPRGFISPISDNALAYYKYKLEGEFKENGKTIYKIKVSQKRLYEPCFNGIIYIVDGDWAIHSLNMTLTKQSGMDLLDTLKLDQLFVPLKKDTWVGKSQVIYFALNIFGFDVNGSLATVYDNQKVNETIPDSIFSNNIISTYDKAANKKDTSYWTETRPIPLEQDEKQDYKIKDSIYKHEQSPEYIDSVRRKGNKISLSNALLTGFTQSTKLYKDKFTINGLLLGMTNYNIVEGLNIAPEINWQHKIDTGKTLYADVAGRYGFSNTHFNGIGRLYYMQRDRNWTGRYWMYGVEGGKYVFQYNPENPVLPLYNTVSALFWRVNDLKIYERKDASAYIRRRYGNGLSWFVKLSYQQRLPLENTTDYSFISGSKAGFADNLPEHLATVTGTKWTKQDAALAHVEISYQPGYKYIQYPDHKAGASNWPIFTLTYDKGIPDIFNSIVDYDKWRFGFTGDLRLKLFGSLSYNIAGGGFLNSTYVGVPDLMQLYGNHTIGYASPYLQSFQFMGYYDFSNKEPLYGEAHLEYHLDGLLSNKIPLLRQARWFIVCGTNTFYASQNDYYAEAFIGIDNIGWKLLRFLRVDFVQAWNSYGGPISGIRLGFKSNAIGIGTSKKNETESEW